MKRKPPLTIVRLGHPALRAVSQSVPLAEIHTQEFQTFCNKLLETCKRADGVGIAAPQVGVNKRVVVVNIHETARYPDRGDSQEYKDIILINPTVTERSSQRDEDWEGDLSSNLYGLVPRSTRCTVKALDRNGKEVTYELTGFPARVFQHEIDHLDGVFLIDRVERKDTIAEREMWEKYHIQ